MKTIVIALACSFLAAFQIHAASVDTWTTAAPREEIRPQFQHTETGGKSGHGVLAIRADEREGLHGWWQKTFSVTAGQYYRFSAWHRAENIAVPRRSVLARVLWRDEVGKEVQRREGVVTNSSAALTKTFRAIGCSPPFMARTAACSPRPGNGARSVSRKWT